MIRYSENIKTIEARIKRLPEIYEKIMYSVCEKQAEKFIKQYQFNLITNKFGNPKLKSETIKAKQRLGYDKPEIPLYGLGKQNDKTYYNMFLTKKVYHGYQIYPRWAKHHKANLELRILLKIHENGATIKRGKTLIRIPPRPIKMRTYEQILREIKKKPGKNRLKEALNNYIQFADKSLLKIVVESLITKENIPIV